MTSAAAIWPVKMASGKFHGEMQTMAPRACVPGSAFGEPKAIRISYTCKPSELTDGLKRLKDFFSELK